MNDHAQIRVIRDGVRTGANLRRSNLQRVPLDRSILEVNRELVATSERRRAVLHNVEDALGFECKQQLMLL